MLPNVSVPHYERTLPSGTVVKFRPFLVSEEIILLQALESGDEKQMRLAVLQVATDCLVEGPDPSQMPWFDVDALIIMLRGYSVGTGMDVLFTCNNADDNKASGKCGEQFKVTFDIEDLKFSVLKTQDPRIELRDGIGVIMKYPTYAQLKNGVVELDDSKQALDLICDSIEQVWDANTVWLAKDMTRQELKDWVATLMNKDMRRMQDFIDSAPSMDFQKKAKCPACGFEHDLKYEDFRTFFS